MDEKTLIEHLISIDAINGFISPCSLFFTRKMEKFQNEHSIVDINYDHAIIQSTSIAKDEKIVLFGFALGKDVTNIREKIRQHLKYGDSKIFSSPIFEEIESTETNYLVELRGNHVNLFTLMRSVIRMELLANSILWISIHTYPKNIDPIFEF